MTFPDLEKMEFNDFSRFSMTGYTLPGRLFRRQVKLLTARYMISPVV